jgi:hypothetical protein
MEIDHLLVYLPLCREGLQHLEGLLVAPDSLAMRIPT